MLMGAMMTCASCFHAIGLPSWTLGLRQAPGSPASLQISRRACAPPIRASALPPGPARVRACMPRLLVGGARVYHGACHGCSMASYELIEDGQMILTQPTKLNRI